MNPPATSDRKSVSIPRRYGRLVLSCEAMLAFPARNAHPRVKAKLVQIGTGGCGVVTEEKLFIGEECLVWALVGGHKMLGIRGHVVWQKMVYEEKEITLVGIEFQDRLELTSELRETLGIRDRT